jgi:hypothetical protein
MASVPEELGAQEPGAEEARAWATAAKKADAAFRAAMIAAGYRRVTITQPQTQHARIVRGEPVMITRGTSPASQCAELGSSGVRGKHFSYDKAY